MSRHIAQTTRQQKPGLTYDLSQSLHFIRKTMDPSRLLTETQPTASTSKPKRKSDAGDEDYADISKPAAKKPRASTGKTKVAHDQFSEAKSIVQQIMASPDGFVAGPDVRAQLIAVAKYAAALQVGEAQGAAGTKIVKEKSEEELEELAEKLRRTVRSQIKKQLVVSPRD